MLRNKSQLELIQLSKKIVQPLLPTFHKGQAGRIVVIGGCEDYTGAPFFAAHSASLLGCDLSHIICEKNAATVIKLYLPDLMVHPYLLDSNNNGASEEDIELKILPKVVSVLSRIHVVIIGPGFGRDPIMIKTLKRIIEEVKVLNIPIILDADALWLIANEPKLIANYKKAILTPNVVEFKRLVDSVIPDYKGDDEIELTIDLSKSLGGVTIVKKGANELIVKNDNYLISEGEGLNRRVGGQGDTLTGSIATFLAWSVNYQKKVWDENPILTEDELTLLACFAGSSVVRLASQYSFKKYGRSMQTLNIHEFLGQSYSHLFPETININ